MFMGLHTRDFIMVQVRLRPMVNCGIKNQEFIRKMLKPWYSFTALIKIKLYNLKNCSLYVPNW